MAVLAQSKPDLAIAAIVVFCVSVGLYLDGDCTRIEQYFLGAIAWCFLFGLLQFETPAIRIQVAVAVAVATLCEYSFAPLYHIYTYRFDNVPAYVPPGHGMVYLTAVALARSALFERYGTLIARVTLVFGGCWALWGVTYAERADTGGAVLFLVFCGFFFVGRSPLLYIAAFYITSYLEIVGTYSGPGSGRCIGPLGAIYLKPIRRAASPPGIASSTQSRYSALPSWRDSSNPAVPHSGACSLSPCA